tara:strand:- start:329 stop:1063 length:735 start_codon:yes stop_codon:yes gene_type:complete
MPSVSKAQQRFMGLVHAYKKGEVPASKVSKAVKDAAKSMKKKSTKDFAKTKHKGLPNKVRSENMNEDGHTDVASVERKLKLIIVDAVDTIKKLRSMSNDDSLPSWWTDKITLAKDYVSKSRDYIMNPTESVNEATSLGADMLLGGIATVIKKAGMRPKTAKMMGGGFKVSKRDKVGFKIDVEIRGLDKKKTFPLQFETERGMLYVVIKNKPIKLGKYTMATQSAQNLKKIGAALIGDKDVKKIS